MKKIFITALSVIVVFTIIAIAILNNGGTAKTLYLLNWGEYIDETLISTIIVNNHSLNLPIENSRYNMAYPTSYNNGILDTKNLKILYKDPNKKSLTQRVPCDTMQSR